MFNIDNYDVQFERHIRVNLTMPRGEKGYSFVATGKQTSIRIAIELKMRPFFSPSSAIISLYNIAADTRVDLQNSIFASVFGITGDQVSANGIFMDGSSAAVEIYAGWMRTVGQSKPPGEIPEFTQLVFTGYVRAVRTFRDGPEIITQLNCVYIPGVNGSTGNNPNLLLNVYYKSSENSTNAKVQGNTSFGLPFNQPSDALRKMVEGTMSKKSDKDRMSIYIGTPQQIIAKRKTNGVFIAALPDGKFSDIIVDTSNMPAKVKLHTGVNLISVSPYTQTDLFYETGIQFQCVFNPNILPGVKVNIQSDLHPRLSGPYPVTYVDGKFDTGGKDAIMNCAALYFLGKLVGDPGDTDN